MRLQTAILTLFTFFSVSGFAGLSPQRSPGLDYTDYLASIADLNPQISSERSSLPLSEVTQWNSMEELQSFFEKSRDERFLAPESAFQRRISWLYPDDGCYARAALVTKKAQEALLPLPHRVFLYGNLSVRTENAPYHLVRWWYHTAPIVQVDGNHYVLDAAINPYKPMLLADWVAAQISPHASHDLRICNPYTYDPRSSCIYADQDPANKAQVDIQEFLKAEWRRQIELQREPEKVLGEEPPWLFNPPPPLLKTAI